MKKKNLVIVSLLAIFIFLLSMISVEAVKYGCSQWESYCPQEYCINGWVACQFRCTYCGAEGSGTCQQDNPGPCSCEWSQMEPCGENGGNGCDKDPEPECDVVMVGPCAVTICPKGWDNSDGDCCQYDGYVTGSGFRQLVFDDASSNGDCDLDLRFTNSWGVITNKIDVTTIINNKDAANSLGAGFTINPGACYFEDCTTATKIEHVVDDSGQGSRDYTLKYCGDGVCDCGETVQSCPVDCFVPECEIGDTEQEECGLCGEKTRECIEPGVWSEWSSCQDEGICEPGIIQTQDCYYGFGEQSRTCLESCYWSGWSDCDAYCSDGVVQGDEECDDGNNVDGDGCSADCMLEEVGECTPHTIGYWKQPCKGHFNHETQSDMESYLIEIHGLADYFDDVTDFNELCDILDPEEPASMEERAGQQLMALWLNVAGDKIFLVTIIDLGLLSDSETVEEALNEAESLISTYPELAKDIADYLNNGNGIIECLPAVCGDGIVEGDEECDVGANNGIPCVPPYDGSCDWCSDVCELEEEIGPFCGDGVKQVPYEECDGSDGVPEGYSCTEECNLEFIPECTIGVVQAVPCGLCGQKTRECVEPGVWSDWSGCLDQGVCVPGTYAERECNDGAGKQSRTCLGNCQWSYWGDCIGECVPGSVDSASCGLCGQKTRICLANYFWGQFSECMNQGICSPGDSQTESCNGGIKTRTCLNNCYWDAWGECIFFCGNGELDFGEECDVGANNGIPCVPPYEDSCQWCSNVCELEEEQGPYCGDGVKQVPYEECDGFDGVPLGYVCTEDCELEFISECTIGVVQAVPCGLCGQKTRECVEPGVWDDWSECAGQGVCEPGSSDDMSCGFSDIGICEFGVQTRVCSDQCSWLDWGECIGAVYPEEEECGDGLDNDCDGSIDENCCVPFTFRAYDGRLDYLGADNSFSYSSVRFNGWMSDGQITEGCQGRLSLQITAKTSDGKSVRASIHVDYEELVELTSDHISLVGVGRGSYWKTGEGLRSIADLYPVLIEIDVANKKLSLVSKDSDLEFSISDMKLSSFTWV